MRLPFKNAWKNLLLTCKKTRIKLLKTKMLAISDAFINEAEAWTPEHGETIPSYIRELGRTTDLNQAGNNFEEEMKAYILISSLLLPGKPWTDANRAMRLCSRLAEEGNLPQYQFILGIFYEKGIGCIEADPVTAHYWIRRSAEQGFENAVAWINKKNE